jgi:hypothetical protein
MIQRCKHLSMETTPSALKSNRSETQGWSQSLLTLGCKKQPPSGLNKNVGKALPHDPEAAFFGHDSEPRMKTDELGIDVFSEFLLHPRSSESMRGST